MVKNLKNKKKKKGFTLIELIIVIAIIAILAAIAIPKFSSVRQSANLKSDIADAKTIGNATSALITEGNITPSTTPISLNTTGGDADKIKSYLQNVPVPKGAASVNFVVKTENGDVKVYISGGTDNLTDANQVYPEPTVTGNKGSNKWYPEKGK